MLAPENPGRLRLLDPGAGVGSLTAAAVEHLVSRGTVELDIVAWEIDESLHDPLRATLEQCVIWAASRGVSVRWVIRDGDYIGTTSAALAGELEAKLEQFDAIVLNPPYRKVNGNTPERQALERVGLPITNLYTAFLALTACQLSPGAVLAAITPRSFANGSYSAPFRRFFFERVGIENLHLFESRAQVFADADVLQENLIFAAREGGWPAEVCISSSYGLTDEASVRKVPTQEVVHQNDPQLFLRIPSGERDTEIATAMVSLPSSLMDLNIAVSTGKVVEFRVRDNLKVIPEPGDAPLIRPNHLIGNQIHWPNAQIQTKPNAVRVSAKSEKLLLPNGTYVVVKRLTAKEEARRVRAAVCDPSAVPGTQIAFENHLNVFHRENRGLPNDIAHGLVSYLNSSFVDLYVRQFNGHTQVNATDLRHLRYPSLRALAELGAVALRTQPQGQEDLDNIVNHILRGSTQERHLEAA